jgi:hypothetical protein
MDNHVGRSLLAFSDLWLFLHQVEKLIRKPYSRMWSKKTNQMGWYCSYDLRKRSFSSTVVLSWM